MYCVYWAVAFLRIYFSAPINPNCQTIILLVGHIMLLQHCTYNVATILQNNKNFLYCTCNVAATLHKIETILQLLHIVTTTLHVGWKQTVKKEKVVKPE